jgi:hypothetical protein
MNQPKLKPCPWEMPDGPRHEVVLDNFSPDAEWGAAQKQCQDWWVVTCVACDISIPKTEYTTKADAIRAWNTRHAEDRNE